MVINLNMINKKAACCILAGLLLISCGSSTSYKSDFYLKGEFSSRKVDFLEKYLKNIASENSLRVYEKDREEMKFLTQGQEAFHLSLYSGDERLPVLSIGNVGSSNILTMDLLSNKTFTYEETKKLSEEIVSYLKTELNVEMKPVDRLDRANQKSQSSN